MLAKAKTSCLSPSDVKRLQFEPYIEDHELVYPRFAGFKIPYFKLDGKPDPSFYRFRFVQTQPSRGFAAITEEPKKPRRYSQPLDTDCGVYLPPLLDATWAEIAKSAVTSVVLTEGELKAACACKLGIPTIGLGGVYNWRSAKRNQDLLPILDKFDWMGRPTTICFDSDAKDNPMVRMAESRLAYVLAHRGAIVRTAKLPGAGDEGEMKQGLDDFIYALGGGDEAFQAFLHLLSDARDIGPGKELHRLNGEVAMIRNTAEVVELATGNVYSQSAFSDTLYRNRKYPDKSDDSGKTITKYAAKEWIGWDHRLDVPELAYEPACNNMLTPEGAFNTWYTQRWPITPKKGDIKPWEKVFKQLFGELSPEHQTWARQWFAYPIQRPGTKLYTAILIWGEPGMGKTFLAEIMQTIYGKNYGDVSHDELVDKFTEWAHNKQFILADEVSVGDKRGLANKLKNMITRRNVMINIKNRKTYSVRDCINYYFASNREDALYIENADRRYFIHNVTQKTMVKAEYDEVRAWWDKGGAAHVFHYFQNEVDLTGFSPTAPAPITSAKQEMTIVGRSEVEDWAADLVQNPNSILKPDQKPQELWQTKDLLEVYQAANQFSKVGHKALSAALNNAGAFRIAHGRNDVMINGNRTRLWAIRNVDQYRKMGAAAAGRAYEAERPNQFKGVGSGQKFAQGKRVQ